MPKTQKEKEKTVNVAIIPENDTNQRKDDEKVGSKNKGSSSIGCHEDKGEKGFLEGREERTLIEYKEDQEHPPMHGLEEEPEITEEWDSEEDPNIEMLGTVEPRFLSQSVGSYFRKTTRGRKINKRKREEEAVRKGYMSLNFFLSKSKGAEDSLGHQ
ncbi:hypothetical protein SUGI_0055080 [Cryptomeria japonica]|nr:hypothetical protein SUGI_0055080 [Cryptomeria japonica]